MIEKLPEPAAGVTAVKVSEKLRREDVVKALGWVDAAVVKQANAACSSSSATSMAGMPRDFSMISASIWLTARTSSASLMSVTRRGSAQW
jgi:hypothetical protein